MLLVQGQQRRTSTRYDLELLHQPGKGVKFKSPNVFLANSYVWKSSSEKTGRGWFWPPHPGYLPVKFRVNKTQELCNMTIFVGSICHEDNKCNLQMFWKECLYKL